jgi:hypothetical protein
MAMVKVEDVIDHLSSEMKRAMAAAVNQVAPDREIGKRTAISS